MDTDKFNQMDTKTNAENQITMIEMGDNNHCAKSSTTEEYKKSGYEFKIFYKLDFLLLLLLFKTKNVLKYQ